MKKFNYLLLGAAGLLMASCSSEEIQAPGQNDGNVTVRVKLPGDLATRANDLGQGKVADNLQIAIYNSEGQYVDSDFTTFNGNLETTVSLELVPGSKYYIAFFAQSQQSETEGVYDFDGENGLFSVNYGNMTTAGNNADAYDCFYTLLETPVITSETATLEATLYRPIAKINWGSSDYTIATVANAFTANYSEVYAELTTTACTQYNLLHQDVIEDSEKDIVIGRFTPAVGEDFPVNPDSYRYAAMQYVLAPREESALLDLSLSVWNAAELADASTVTTIDVLSAPVQANYQTNIYGSLFTENVEITVDKDKVWGTPSYTVGVSVWDGQTVTRPLIDSNARTIVLTKASDLPGLANLVNSSAYSGYTITMTQDFDMDGNTIPSIGTASRSILGSTPAIIGNKPFSGTFDGQGHTISNFTINGTSSSSGSAGFLPLLSGSSASLQNVTFENVVINAPSNEQAGIVGMLYNGAKVSNVTVKSGTITAKGGAGGIVGRILQSGSVSDCENYANVTINGDASGGGIVGAAYYTSNATSLNISGCKNYGTIAIEGSGTQTIGGIVGTSGANIDNCTNYGTVGTNTTNGPVGGIAGYQNSAGHIINCVNEGAVTGASQVAGIVAFIGGTSYTFKGQIDITGCTNKGVLNGTGTVGGILGINRNTVFLTGNTNSAPSITSTGNAAGIVGNGYVQGSPISGGNGYCNLSGNVNTTPIADIHGSKVNEIFTGEVMIDGESQKN